MPKKIYRPRVIQIMPADGWYAEYETPNGIKRWPLACWAIIEEEGEDETIFRDVYGLTDSPGDSCVSAHQKADFALPTGWGFIRYWKEGADD